MRQLQWFPEADDKREDDALWQRTTKWMKWCQMSGGKETNDDELVLNTRLALG